MAETFKGDKSNAAGRGQEAPEEKSSIVCKPSSSSPVGTEVYKSKNLGHTVMRQLVAQVLSAQNLVLEKADSLKKRSIKIEIKTEVEETLGDIEKELSKMVEAEKNEMLERASYSKRAASRKSTGMLDTPPVVKRGRSSVGSSTSSIQTKSSTPPRDEDLPEFDPEKFIPGYVPKTVKKGDDEYAIVVSGVPDTGLCGKYWGDVTSLPPRRRKTSMEKPIKKPKKNQEHQMISDKATNPVNLKPIGKSCNEEENKIPSPVGMPDVEPEQFEKPTEPDSKEKYEPRLLSHQIKDAPPNQYKELAKLDPKGRKKSMLCVAGNTQAEMMVECFAPYDDCSWVNMGKKEEGMVPDAVQYARAVRPPYHLVSFLRIKGHSVKGMSCTDKNTMVFVVIEGEVSVVLHKSQFVAKKGDSFYIPPKNNYNLINQKESDAEVSLIQFQYD